VNNGFDGLLITFDHSVFYKDNRLSNWQPFINGLPRNSYSDAFVLDSIQKFRLGTRGRGFWESYWYDASQAPVADFISDKDSVCPGGAVKFYDNSLNHGPGFTPIYNWTFQGGLPSTSVQANPLVIYNSIGTFNVSLTISNVNGTDSITRAGYIEVKSPLTVSVPFSQDFEGMIPPPLWEFIPSYKQFHFLSWNQLNPGGYGSSLYSLVCRNSVATTSNDNFRVTMPQVDLSGLQNPILHFDRAYAMDTVNADTLKVYYTLDCGDTRYYLYSKGGMNLSTAPPTHYSFGPDSSQWATDTIVLTGLPGILQIGFEVFGYQGNWLYLDNINITEGLATSIQQVHYDAGKLQVYPVPANDKVYIEVSSGTTSIVSVRIINSMGQIVSNGTVENGVVSEFNTSDYPPGIYKVRADFPDGILSRSLLLIK
jgi:PKD repeat protein